jgi:hypothetical protein
MAVTEDGDLIALRYRLVQQVGSGAMGVVWRAEDEILRRTVAVKELLLHWGMSEAQTEEARRRAMREGRIAARLHHPNAISVYDVVEHDGRPCLIMEYLPSESLSDLLLARHTLPPVDVARIGGQIASALAAAHDAGIVHRDVKPGNVLLAEDGNAKLTDFGISRAVGDSTITATGVLAGTPAYLAPEIAQGYDAGFPSDVFSLGATLYAAVEGLPPFGLNDNPMALLHYISTNEITPPKQAGPLTATLVWMLTRDAERRPTMREAAQALDAIAGAGEADVPVPVPVAALAPTAVQNPVAEPPVAEPPVAEPPVTVPPVAPVAVETPVPTDAPPVDSTPAPTVAAVPAAAPPPSGPVAPPTRDGAGDRKRRGILIAGALVVAVLVVTGVLVAVLTNDNSGNAATGGPGDPTTNAAKRTTTPLAPTSTDRSSARQTTTTTRTTTTTTPPTTTTTTPPSAANGAPPATSDQLANTITDYYRLLPGGVDQGWSWMTANYQQNHAHGFTAYKQFWAQFSKVTATNVRAEQPSTVTALITYYYKNGSASPEQTTFHMVAQDGQWKIDTSSG